MRVGMPSYLLLQCLVVFDSQYTRFGVNQLPGPTQPGHPFVDDRVAAHD